MKFSPERTEGPREEIDPQDKISMIFPPERTEGPWEEIDPCSFKKFFRGFFLPNARKVLGRKSTPKTKFRELFLLNARRVLERKSIPCSFKTIFWRIFIHEREECHREEIYLCSKNA
jgi:hypothetical protein